MNNVAHCLLMEELMSLIHVASALYPMLHRGRISSTTEEGVPIRKLFIGNLAERTTNKDLQKLFSKFGKVDSCYIKRTQRRSSFAFVTFSGVDAAVKAREAAKKMEVHLHCRILRVSPADTWHQPDSLENQMRFLKNKEGHEDEVVEQLPQDDSPIQVLNDDCFIEIFLHLPIADRVRIERVCKRWQSLAQESWRSVKKLDLVKEHWGISPKARLQMLDTNTLRKVLMKCGQFLAHLDLSIVAYGLTSSTLTIVGKFCPNLEFLNIRGLELSPSGIASLMKNCQHMTKFVMKSLNGPCEKNLSQLFAMSTKLQSLEIQDESINGKCLGYLPTDTIEEISMSRCISLQSTHFDSAVVKFTALRKITLKSCICLLNSSLKAIGTIESLTHLELSGDYAMFSAVHMNHLVNLKNLEHLNLSHHICVTDDFLVNVSKNCKKLNYLDITGCMNVTDRAIVSLSALSKLETLVISGVTQVTDKPLATLHNLRVLKACKCPLVRDSGAIDLIRMAPNLVLLDLSRSSISDLTIQAAISITKRRTNNLMLKLIVGQTNVKKSQVLGVSPLLQIVNVDMS
ncbi:F-box/LRR-repeat protein 7-like [Fopius arisanus]|uniref:EEED8.10_1 protein n=2 Tax=Fopius arisanus TaxID=64838 RepID=A0A0C9RLY4_9HYME|nr:PREDICTED: F-box/LRR-repeat protein 7-like [Fopius arisanus]